MKSTLFIILSFLSMGIYAQTMQVSNSNPKEGETIELRYTPNEKSKFKAGDQVYLRCTALGQDYSQSVEMLKMQEKEGIFTTSLNLQKGYAAYNLTAQNEEGNDPFSTINIPIQSISGGYYPNAFVNASNYFQVTDSLHQKELTYNPNNHYAKAQKWRLTKDLEALRTDLAKFTKSAKKNESYYYALALGQAKLGDLEKSLAYYQSLMDQYPTSFLIADTYGVLVYQIAVQNQQAKFLTLRAMVTQFIVNHPHSSVAKEYIGFLYKSEKFENWEAIRTIAQYWMEKDPSDAMMYYYYAQVSPDNQEKLFYLEKASSMLLHGEHRLKNLYIWRGMLVSTLPQIIKAYLDTKAYASALALAYFYEQNSPKIESSFYLLKANILNALDRREEALETYIYAGDLGEEVAKDSALVQYKQLLGQEKGYAEYAYKIQKKIFYAEETNPAPNFQANNLAGEIIHLEDLKGKVVVLNFWFISCYPCRIEMPGLNEMVKAYEDDEIVFLAFALDESEKLRNFLAKTPFDYQIIPEAQEIAHLYNVSSYPVHIVIDKEGNIRSKLFGGSANRHKDLEPLINRALKF